MQLWSKVNEKIVYDGYRKVLRRTFELPNGEVADFDVIKSGAGAAILAVTEENRILCFRQFRPGPEDILFELPGGVIDEGEEPVTAMRRELLEETGYEATIEHIGSYYRDAYITGKWQMFVGREAKKVCEPNLEATEFGELTLLSVTEFKEKLFAGLMSDTTLGYAALHHLDML